MSATLETSLNEAPFDALAERYDETFTFSRIGQAQRTATWEEFDRVFQPGQRILELNCGTGVDAIHLAARGVEVLACDSAPRLIEVARRAFQAERQVPLRAPCEFQVLRSEEIGRLQEERAPRQFDGAISNFAGLNCVEDLAPVARDLTQLLKPGSRVVLCLFGRFCVWEILWHSLHGHPAKAFRRLRSQPGVAHLSEEVTVQVRYPSVRSLTRTFAPHFRLERWKGVGVAVPPSYVEPLAQRFPRALNWASRADRWLGSCPGLKATADHVLLTFARIGT